MTLWCCMCASYDGKCASTKYFKLQIRNLQVHFHSQILDPLFIRGRLIPHSGKQDRQRTYNVAQARSRKRFSPWKSRKCSITYCKCEWVSVSVSECVCV
jgi:hypothetical protein